MLRSEAGRRAQGLALYGFDARYTVPRERLQLALTVLGGILMRAADAEDDAAGFEGAVLEALLRARREELVGCAARLSDRRAASEGDAVLLRHIETLLTAELAAVESVLQKRGAGGSD